MATPWQPSTNSLVVHTLGEGVCWHAEPHLSCPPIFMCLGVTGVKNLYWENICCEHSHTHKQRFDHWTLLVYGEFSSKEQIIFLIHNLGFYSPTDKSILKVSKSPRFTWHFPLTLVAHNLTDDTSFYPRCEENTGPHASFHGTLIVKALSTPMVISKWVE